VKQTKNAMCRDNLRSGQVGKEKKATTMGETAARPGQGKNGIRVVHLNLKKQKLKDISLDKHLGVKEGR